MVAEKMNKKSYTLYILECQNGHYYTGYTTDLKRRYQEHCQGTSKSKYTRAFPPKIIAQQWTFTCTRSAILSLEHKVKTRSHKQKQQLINAPDTLNDLINTKKSAP